MDPTGALELMCQFENELIQALGDFGNHQILIIALLLFPVIYSSYIGKDFVFATRVPNYRCYVPVCDELSNLEFLPSWYHNAIPTDSVQASMCSRYENVTSLPNQIVENLCPAWFFNRTTLLPCDHYIYQSWGHYMTMDFSGLHCNNKLKMLPSVVSSIGSVIAFPMAGALSDAYGRRTAIVFLAFNGALFGVFKGFSECFEMYLIFQFIQIIFSGGLFSVCYVLSFEVNHSKYRVVTSAFMFTMNSLGSIFLCLAAVVERYWRTYTWIVFAPGFALIAYQLLLTESYRWLLSTHKFDMAKTTLLKVARQNNKKISAKTMNFLLNAIFVVDAQLKTKHTKSFSARVWKSSVLLSRLCILSVMWFLSIIVHLGLVKYPFPLSSSMYTNFVIKETLAIPGYWTASVLLNRYGRKPILVGGYIICGLSCLVFTFFIFYETAGSTIFYVISQYTSGLIMLSLYLFSCELLPTRHRNLLLGIVLMAGSIGSILTNWISEISDVWKGIPSIVIGIASIVAALLTLTFPEMLGHKVPDTFEEAEFIKKI